MSDYPELAMRDLAEQLLAALSSSEIEIRRSDLSLIEHAISAGNLREYFGSHFNKKGLVEAKRIRKVLQYPLAESAHYGGDGAAHQYLWSADQVMQKYIGEWGPEERWYED